MYCSAIKSINRMRTIVASEHGKLVLIGVAISSDVQALTCIFSITLQTSRWRVIQGLDLSQHNLVKVG